MHIEYRLTELIGDVGKKLHTARSRNDQVVTTFKMYVKDELKEVDNLLKELQGALIEQADLHIDSAMPGFTHLQIAQPIILAHHLLAYVEMFGRDRERVTDALNRMNKSPLGAAALAGTSFPIDSKKTSKRQHNLKLCRKVRKDKAVSRNNSNRTPTSISSTGEATEESIAPALIAKCRLF